jgi:virulence factor
MTTSPLRIGMVGAGQIAQVAQLPALARRDDVEIQGVVTRTETSADRNLRRWPIRRSFADAESMIRNEHLDALFVLTPRASHDKYVRLGLESDLDVFCEKPWQIPPTKHMSSRSSQPNRTGF